MENTQITKNEALDKLVKAAAEATTSITLAAQELKIFNLETELEKVKKLYEEQSLIALDASLENTKLKEQLTTLEQNYKELNTTSNELKEKYINKLKENEKLKKVIDILKNCIDITLTNTWLDIWGFDLEEARKLTPNELELIKEVLGL